MDSSFLPGSSPCPVCTRFVCVGGKESWGLKSGKKSWPRRQGLGWEGREVATVSSLAGTDV